LTVHRRRTGHPGFVRNRSADDLPVVNDLSGLVDLVSEATGELYVRWSHGPRVDLAEAGDVSSRDGLTGVPLPGLSANPLRVESWWGDRPLRLWLARRLYDYRHLRELRGPGVRPWVLAATESGRGPDNEPLVTGVRPLAWIDDAVLAECEREVARQHSPEWGPLDRRS
jgi:hypothetical protein